jgi:hypothetical protein
MSEKEIKTFEEFIVYINKVSTECDNKTQSKVENNELC